MLPHLPGVPHLHVNRPLLKKNSNATFVLSAKPAYWLQLFFILTIGRYTKCFEECKDTHHAYGMY